MSRGPMGIHVRRPKATTGLDTPPPFTDWQKWSVYDNTVNPTPAGSTRSSKAPSGESVPRSNADFGRI